MNSYTPVTALLRGLAVLSCLNEHGPQNVGELHQHTGIAKPTVVRILETLQHAGYVDAGNDQRRYSVTARVLSLANGYDLSTHVLKAALPFIHEAREQLGWPIEIGVFDQDAMIILDTSRQSGAFSINRRPGSRVPVLKTALGRAYLAALPHQALAALLDKLATNPAPDFELARRPAEFLAMIQQIRLVNYSLADRETLSNGRALAAPILREGKPIASINIIVHTSALTIEQLETEIGPSIIEVAQKISRAIA